MVIDLHHLNKHCRVPTTRFKTLATLSGWMEPESWMIAWDFRDAYMHLRFRSDFIKNVTIQVSGVY